MIICLTYILTEQHATQPLYNTQSIPVLSALRPLYRARFVFSLSLSSLIVSNRTEYAEANRLELMPFTKKEGTRYACEGGEPAGFLPGGECPEGPH